MEYSKKAFEFTRSIAEVQLLRKTAKLIAVSAGVSLCFATIGLVTLYKVQNYLVYPSSINEGRKYHGTPDDYGMPYESVQVKTDDGEILDCFSIKQNPSDPKYCNKTVIILGPNAGNISHSLPSASIFYHNLKCNVFLFNYRGYGKSTGQPNEVGIKKDAVTILQYIMEDSQFAKSKVVLYGRSLGGAVSIFMASYCSQFWKEKSSLILDEADVELVGLDDRLKHRKPQKTTEEEHRESAKQRETLLSKDLQKDIMVPKISGIVLENTFLSITKVIPYIFPILKKVAFCCNQIWPSEQEILKVSEDIPVLFLSGLKDEIVPPEHMKALFEYSKSTKKSFYEFPDGHHNNTWGQGDYWIYIGEFVNEIN